MAYMTYHEVWDIRRAYHPDMYSVCAEGDVLLAVPLGICETPHDLRPEHAALPALLVAARAGDGCAGGGGGGVHGLF